MAGSSASATPVLRIGPRAGPARPRGRDASTTTGHGYALLAADGTVLPFGDAQSYGAATGVGPVVGFAGRLLPKH